MRLIDRLLGWREIQTEGEATKALTDLLLQNAIPAEIVEAGGSATVRLGRADAKTIVGALREKQMNATLGRIRGLPACLLSLLRRPGILVGVMCAFLFLLFARGRIWEIRIAGDGSLDEDTVRSVLYSAGLRPGMAIRDVSPEEVSTECLLRDDLFSGVTVSLSGVVARVEWLGRKGEAAIPSHGEAGGVNLVASRDAVIVSVQPTCGTAAVVPGQTVHKGDLLISGVNKGGTVRASGVVLARVTDEFSSTADCVEFRKKIGKAKPVSFSLLLFGEKILSFGYGEDAATETDLTLPGGIVLPFSIRIGHAHAVTEETVLRSESEMARSALRRLDWIVREALSEGELLKKEVTGVFSEGGYTATAKTEYLINIAEPLAFSARNEYNK